jgi:hypothetical protein
MGISDSKRIEKLDMEWNLKKIMEEEICKKQTVREKFINEGDENTKLFHLLAKGRKQRVKIPFLNHDGISVSDTEGINKFATSYYKDLFGPSVLPSINMSHFNMIFEMKHNSAPGPDGFPAEFFQKIWDTIHLDIVHLFNDFYNGNLKIERLNYRMVTLLPKVDNAADMKNFRPICLLNVCYKIISKVLNNRLAGCITNVISDSQ